MIIEGRVWKFGDDVNTDYIISGRYKFKTLDMKELAKHVFEDIRPDFAKKVREGDIIVAGRNFGCGSSREQAPLAIKYSGVSAVIAKSFARIFYRNSINIGLFVFECENIDGIEEKDVVRIDVGKGYIICKEKSFKIKPMPKFMLEILKEGGIVSYIKKHGDFKVFL